MIVFCGEVSDCMDGIGKCKYIVVVKCLTEWGVIADTCTHRFGTCSQDVCRV